MLINIIFGCLKKRNICKSAVTIQCQNCILYIISCWQTFFQNLRFYKEQLYNILPKHIYIIYIYIYIYEIFQYIYIYWTKGKWKT